MFLREFKNEKEKDEFFRFALEKYVIPLEKFIGENFTTDTVLIVAHDYAMFKDKSYSTFCGGE